MDFSGLKQLLPDPKTSLKTIKGKHYIYRQEWDGHKLSCSCAGLATPEQVDQYKNRKVISWLLKNESVFIEALQFLQAQRDKERQSTINTPSFPDTEPN